MELESPQGQLLGKWAAGLTHNSFLQLGNIWTKQGWRKKKSI